jgi:hypothetical protein
MPCKPSGVWVAVSAGTGQDGLGFDQRHLAMRLAYPDLLLVSTCPSQPKDTRRVNCSSPARTPKSSLAAEQGRLCEIEQWDCGELQQAISGGGEF